VAKLESESSRFPRAALIIAVGLGVLAGVGGYTFSYAKGFSYFSTDPSACANCHIMQRQYDSWQAASHHTSAVCVDCHLPHEFVPKYLAKAENGWRHGKLFTTGGFKEPIEVQRTGRKILQANCVRCHEALAFDMQGHGVGEGPVSPDERVECTHCHWTVGHGVRAGLGGPVTAAEIETIERQAKASLENH
jgi:cytochrome c nitrite reductase small subunit